MGHWGRMRIERGVAADGGVTYMRRWMEGEAGDEEGLRRRSQEDDHNLWGIGGG